MRFIYWDDELAQRTYSNYYERFKTYANFKEQKIWGNVTEALVQQYYQQPINETPSGHSDEGWDMKVEGIKIDIKADVNKIQWFGAPTSSFTIRCDKPLKADYYLFTQIDPDTKTIALVGYLTREEVILLGKHYRKDEHVTPAFIAECEQYRVYLADIHPINPIES